MNQTGNERDARRLKQWLALIFLSLALPTGALVWQAYQQLKFEAFYNFQNQAEQLVGKINRTLIDQALLLNQRGASDFQYFRDTLQDSNAVVERSPLTAFPIPGDMPGLLGYFEVDAQGQLSSPLLPGAVEDRASTGLREEEISARAERISQLQEALFGKRLADTSVVRRNRQDGGGAEAQSFDTASVAADTLKSNTRRENALGQLRDLQLNAELQQQSARRGALEDSADREPEALTTAPVEQVDSEARMQPSVEHTPLEAPITTFALETEPFRFSLLDDKHVVLFRNASRNGERVVQGALLDQETFIDEAVTAEFRSSTLSDMSDLVVGFGDDVIRIVQGESNNKDRYSSTASTLDGSLLHQARLPAPFEGLQLIFSVKRLPPGPAARVLGWTTLVITVVLIGGFLLLLRLGRRQLQLARQQRDFVSAVSHELKTPLTSIRMYGELLKSGWSEENRRQQYYEYIHDEAERLSRLIDNVLQLSQLTRSGQQFDLQQKTAAELADQVRSKVADQTRRAGYDLRVSVSSRIATRRLLIDPDCFMQIAINLIDNGMKFSKAADEKRIDCHFEQVGDSLLKFSVRDYGPGIPRAQRQRIFELFYRPEAELTRETPGTGIGLAIVSALAQGMHGQVDVTNRNPGAEFQVSFPLMD